jgi:hypothetical protein
MEPHKAHALAKHRRLFPSVPMPSIPLQDRIRTAYSTMNMAIGKKYELMATGCWRAKTGEKIVITNQLHVSMQSSSRPSLSSLAVREIAQLVSSGSCDIILPAVLHCALLFGLRSGLGSSLVTRTTSAWEWRTEEMAGVGQSYAAVCIRGLCRCRRARVAVLFGCKAEWTEYMR